MTDVRETLHCGAEWIGPNDSSQRAQQSLTRELMRAISEHHA